MGRGKIEIKRIENPTNRQVTFSKRKNGILKKAREIAVLCDAEISLVVFSNTNKMTEFCSPTGQLGSILNKYQKTSGRMRLWDPKHEYLYNEVDRIKKENDSMQIELRHLKGEDLTSLTPKELIPIEAALLNGIDKVKAKQNECHKMLKKRVKMGEDEKERLTLVLHQRQMGLSDENIREMENAYHQKGRDYPSQMPFPYHVQPIQPNLHESK